MGEAASGRENGEKCTDSREKPQVKIMRTCLLIQLGNEVEGRIKDASQISSLRDWELAEHPCRLMKEPAWEGGWWCFECLSREKPSHVWKQKKQLRSFTLHWVSHQMVMTLLQDLLISYVTLPLTDEGLKLPQCFQKSPPALCRQHMTKNMEEVLEFS